MKALRLRVLPGRLAVARLPGTATLPGWADGPGLVSITRREGELSIVCAEARVPADVRAERGWRALEVEGTIDFRGNQGYLTQHFGNSPLRGVVTPMLLTLTIIELSAGVLCGVGLVELFVLGVARIAFWGICVAATAFLALFFGQRIAKDYTGAAVLPAYFLVALIGLYMTGLYAMGRIR